VRLLSFDVDPRGRRILCCVQSAASVPSELTIVLNWSRWLEANR
jgi:hypothetical protein